MIPKFEKHGHNRVLAFAIIFVTAQCLFPGLGHQQQSKHAG